MGIKKRILIVEDDELIRLSLSSIMQQFGEVVTVDSAALGKKVLTSKNVDLALLDLDLEGDLLGLDLINLAVANNIYPVVLSGRDEDRYIRESYKRGANDFIAKPFKRQDVEMVWKKFVVLNKAGELSSFFANSFVTVDENLIKHLSQIEEFALSERPVLILGASGTGKTLLAKKIHLLSNDDFANFVHLNCSEIPDNLLEAELFGYEKGAFTGAEKRKKGRIELADQGTLFLDELATMPISLQKKILKTIEEGSFFPLGSETAKTVQFRLISATCEDLAKMVACGTFREDLYYRIEGHNLMLPPLKERPVDIPHLIKYFLNQKRRRIIISPEAMNCLLSYSWPGNVRELEKVIDILLAKKGGMIERDDLPKNIKGSVVEDCDGSLDVHSLAVADVLTEAQHQYVLKNGMPAFIEKIEEELVESVLTRNNNHTRQTIADLKISNNTFYRILERVNNAKNK